MMRLSHALVLDQGLVTVQAGVPSAPGCRLGLHNEDRVSFYSNPETPKRSRAMGCVVALPIDYRSYLDPASTYCVIADGCP